MTHRPYVSVEARSQKASRAKPYWYGYSVRVGFALASTPRGGLVADGCAETLTFILKINY